MEVAPSLDRALFRNDFWKDMAAWLISLLVHLAAMILLGMWTLDAEDPQPELVLSVEIGPTRTEGAEPEEEEFNPADFTLPVDKPPENPQELAQLKQAEQDVRELLDDPRNQSRMLPNLSRVKADLVSDDPYRRMHAARDPRVRAQIVRHEGGTTMTEAAVARALRWMSQHQNEDGSWSLHAFHRCQDCQGKCSGQGNIRSDTGGTALVLLAMLGADQTHQAGRYQAEVSRALGWLLQRQTENGDLRADSAGNSGMYSHALASIALCDAFKLTGDETLRAPAQKSIDFICQAQHTGGGWRYQPGQAGDTSVVGWQLMAIHSARSAFLHVPRRHTNLAGQYLDRAETRRSPGRFAYQPGGRATPAMTAEGLLSRMYLGADRTTPGMEEGVRWLIDNHLPNRKQANIYYWYYGTQVMHHWGGEPWETWNRAMRDVLVTSQATSGHEAGSWGPELCPHGSRGGRLYVTALATCTLEVYYRYAPLYHKIRLD